jgi:hypothetical protein
VITRRLAVAIGFLFAVIGAQWPEFAQQYRQRLGGALDELNRMIAEFDNQARSQSLSREQGLARLERNDDPLARQRADAVNEEIDRADRLSKQKQAFAEAGPVNRLVTLVENFDPETMAQAWRDYEPALPTTSEAFIVGGVSLVVGWCLTHAIAWPIRKTWRARQGRGRRVGHSLEF